MNEETPARDESTPPYQRIADVLRGEIVEGRFRVGERIPSQAELEERFQVSRPTVQRALTELRKGGYIDNQRGRAAQVQPWQDRGGTAPAHSPGPEPTYAVLEAHVAAAFEHEHVTIDAFSLTTETLNPAITTQFQRIQRGELATRSIRVRLLLPSLKTRLAIPQQVADPADERPLRRLRQLISGQVITLNSAFSGLYDVKPEIEQSVEFRSVPITPVQKLYLLNSRTALSGYYRVVPRQIPFGGGEAVEIYDVLGLNAVLFPHQRDPDAPQSRDSLFVAESQAWFDSLWSSIAQPMTLFE